MSKWMIAREALAEVEAALKIEAGPDEPERTTWAKVDGLVTQVEPFSDGDAESGPRAPDIYTVLALSWLRDGVTVETDAVFLPPSSTLDEQTGVLRVPMDHGAVWLTVNLQLAPAPTVPVQLNQRQLETAALLCELVAEDSDAFADLAHGAGMSDDLIQAADVGALSGVFETALDHGRTSGRFPTESETV
jgi:hypothetical protein